MPIGNVFQRYMKILKREEKHTIREHKQLSENMQFFLSFFLYDTENFQ